ncbi:hypothetical protein [Oricola thermophila]|uniref:DUF2269 family protein n=1 Tax=Oricola thermophila TaxID=2742145 RepID=A0A6N1VBQ0_9HYPH|nr:hypothetical protein [Oricola thermophila]QKV18441.1 hypothetical protein HTY61_08245 [Oricola thermophila]
MIVIAKIIHFLCFTAGVGGGIAAALVGARAKGAGPDTAPVLRGIQRTLGRIGFGAVILLWLSGIYLVHAIHGGWTGLGTVFWLKIVAVAVLTAASVTGQYIALTAARRDMTAMGPRMALIGMTATLAAITALILAVIAFGSN